MIDLLDFISPTDHAAVFSGTGVYADDALEQAVAFGASLGTIPAIMFPAGRLKFARTVYIRNRVTPILSDADRNAAEAWLAAKAGVTL